MLKVKFFLKDVRPNCKKVLILQYLYGDRKSRKIETLAEKSE